MTTNAEIQAGIHTQVARLKQIQLDAAVKSKVVFDEIDRLAGLIPPDTTTPPPPVATVPSMPMGLVAVAGDKTVALAWTAPASDGGSPITGYRIIGGPASFTTPGMSVTVAGLTNGTAYSFTVAAINDVGIGAPSGGVTATPVGPPPVGSGAWSLGLAWFQQNTGPLAAPTKTRSGNFTAADAGKTFDGYTFDGGIFPNGVDNVTIRNSIVRGRVAMGYGDASGWRFEQCELDGSSIGDDQSMIGDAGVNLYRCNVHGGSSGVRFQGAGTRVVECWIHDLVIRDPAAHRSGIGCNGPCSDTQILRNWVDPASNSDIRGLSASLALYGDFGKVTDVLVEGNLLGKSGSYSTYGGSCSAKPYPSATGVRYLNNVIVPSQYGSRGCWDNPGAGCAWTGNVDTAGNPV